MESLSAVRRNFQFDRLRRWLRMLSVVTCLSCISQFAHATNPLGTQVGAIRWDAWDGGPIGSQMEAALAPSQYQYRVPYFAPWGSYAIRGNTPEVMDQEIQAATDAGLDFWAFCYYPSSAIGNGMDYARKNFLASTNKRGLKFTYLLGVGPVEDYAEVAAELRHPSYLKVVGDRPLVFLFTVGESLRSTDYLDVAELRQRAADAGLPTPYIVILNFDPWTAAYFAAVLGADAVSSYATPNGTFRGSPYSNLAEKERTNWDNFNWAAYNYGKKTVPWVTTGWDPRPLIQTPPSWGTWANEWTYQATPAQIATQVQEAINWSNYQSGFMAETNAVLMYAWNEYAEGGWLSPMRTGGSERLNAIADVIRDATSEPPSPPGMTNVYRFYNGWPHSDHFLTTSYQEGLGSGYQYEGLGFAVFSSPVDGDMYPIWRCQVNGFHFVSTDPGCEGTANEGAYGYVSSYPRAGYSALHRYYSWQHPGDHLVTVSVEPEGIYGWVYEGVLGYIPY